MLNGDQPHHIIGVCVRMHVHVFVCVCAPVCVMCLCLCVYARVCKHVRWKEHAKYSWCALIRTHDVHTTGS